MTAVCGIRIKILRYRLASCKLFMRPYGYKNTFYVFSESKRPYSSHIDRTGRSCKHGQWKSVVGLEIHAQIAVKSKLFSSGGTDYTSHVNTMVANLDASLPGTLPVLNRQCVEAAVLTGLALQCKINKTSLFDRKHYFYADLPVGYQITQQFFPIAQDGFVEFIVSNPQVTSEPYVCRSKIKQIQLEQDSGRSIHIHEEQHSLVDLNRAGIGLMEIVLEPDLKNGEEAAALVKELMLILTAINTCSCKMEEGAFRVDANISVHRTGEPLGTRTEVKNLNSKKSLVRAVNYEIQRQIRELEAGRKITNETMTYNIKLKQTVPMRDKEVVQDYRFMPEPNLPPLVLCDDKDLETNKDNYININRVQQRLPRLPDAYRQELINKFGMNISLAALITETEGGFEYFNKLMSICDLEPNSAVTIFTNDLLVLLESNKLSCNNSPITVKAFSEIIQLKTNKEINSAAVTQLITLILDGDKRSPRTIVEEENMFMVDDDIELEKLCNEVIVTCKGMVKHYKKGKVYALPNLLEKVQLMSNGKADLERAREMLIHKIEGGG